MRVLTLVLSFGLFFRFLIDLLRQLPTNVAEIRHCDASVLQTLLSPLELIIREFELTQQVADTIGHTTTGE